MAAGAAVIALVVLLAQGYNMLGYPYLEDDEATYFAQGWSIFHLGKLAPYTYFYDHAPFGWIQIALWQAATLGHRFGYALASGRILMLLFQIASALLVLTIGRRVSGKVWVGVLAALLFTLSPYGLLYHRRILLDNIATFWILLSMLLLTGRVTLRKVWLSGVALGIAVLSKEIAAAAIPAVAILAARQAPKENRPFALGGWLFSSLSVCSLYPLMALIRGEFFPAGPALGGTHPHVSLLCSLEWQAGRDAGHAPWDLSSPFWKQAIAWGHQEPLLVIGGTGAALVCLVLFRKQPFISMLGWTIISLWFFLDRGGTIIPFYLVPLLPLLGLAVALVMGQMATLAYKRKIRGGRHCYPRSRTWSQVLLRRSFLVLGVCVCILLMLVAYDRAGSDLWTSNPVLAQRQAVGWIRNNVPSHDRLVIDMYMWNDLHGPPSDRPAYNRAEYYWKAGEDPLIRKKTFHNDWRNVDYVIATPQVYDDANHQFFPVVTKALEHSRLVTSFDSGGWPVEIRRVGEHLRPQMRLSQHHFKPPPCMTYGN